jgi:hypothetical protein
MRSAGTPVPVPSDLRLARRSLFEDLKKSLLNAVHCLRVRLDLINEIEGEVEAVLAQVEAVLDQFKAESPRPNDAQSASPNEAESPGPNTFSSPHVFSLFLILANLCRRIIYGTAGDPQVRQEPIIKFFACCEFPINLEVPSSDREGGWMPSGGDIFDDMSEFLSKCTTGPPVMSASDLAELGEKTSGPSSGDRSSGPS